MRQEMAATAHTCQPKVVQCPTLRSHLGVVRQIHQLRVGCATILSAILLDETVKLLPLAGKREIACIAFHYDWEIHLPFFLFVRDSSFFAD